MSEAQALTPRCPECGADPVWRVGRHGFCATRGCRVLSWDAGTDAVELRRDATEIDLSNLLDDER